MLWSGEEAVFVGRRLVPCQKDSSETPQRGNSSHSTLVGFSCIGKWSWTQFFPRACVVGWLTNALLMAIAWSIIQNARRRCFQRGYLRRMAQRRCHSGFIILFFWFDSSRCPSVTLLRPDYSVLQASWRGSESEADFHFPWPTAWSKWRPFLWFRILPPLLVSPQLCCPGSRSSCLLDWASQCIICERVVLIGWLGADVTLAEKISWIRRSGYTETSFCSAIRLLGTLCRACIVPTGRYGPFCDARYPRL